jgi:hypothetical protein
VFSGSSSRLYRQYFQARAIAFNIHRIFSLRLSLDNCLASLSATESPVQPEPELPVRPNLVDCSSQRRLSCCANTVIRLQRTRCPNEIRATTTLDTLPNNRRSSAAANFGYQKRNASTRNSTVSPNNNQEDADLTPTLESNSHLILSSNN